MMQPRQPQQDSDAQPASRPPARLTGTAVLAAVAVAVALALPAAPAAARPQAAARTSTVSASQINCPPPHPEATPQTGGISDC